MFVIAQDHIEVSGCFLEDSMGITLLVPDCCLESAPFEELPGQLQFVHIPFSQDELTLLRKRTGILYTE